MALVDAIFFSPDRSSMAIYDIANAHPSLLPHLLAQFSLQEYAAWAAFGEGGVRSVIANALPISRYKGTPWAIDFALGLAGVKAEVREWWQRTPNGEPYTFDVTVWANENLAAAIDLADAGRMAQLQAVIEAVRPKTRRTTIYVGYRFPVVGSPGAIDESRSLAVAATISAIAPIVTRTQSVLSALPVAVPIAAVVSASPPARISAPAYSMQVANGAAIAATPILSPRVSIAAA